MAKTVKAWSRPTAGTANGTPVAAPPPPTARRPLPQGASAWSRTYVDERGMPAMSPHLVPVDGAGRCQWVRYTCPGRIEVDGAAVPCDQDEWADPTSGPVGKFCPGHGAELVRDGEQSGRGPVLPWHAMWQRVEPAARPLWLIAAEAAAGGGLIAGHLPAWMPLAATPVLAAGAYAGTRQWLSRRRERVRPATVRRRARAAGYAAVAAGGWLSAAAVVDSASVPGMAVWAALPVLGGVAAVPWWRYLEQLRHRPAPAVAEPALPAGPTADQLAEADAVKRWADDVAIAHTRLTEWKRIPFGWEAVIVATKRGALNSLGGENTKATVKKVAGGYDVLAAAVTWIEDHDGSPNKARLLVQPNNPLAEGQIWPGPDSIDMDSGRAEMGRFVDGTPMYLDLYRYGWGAPSEVGLGTTGAGKSEHVRQRLVIERWASFVDADGMRRGSHISMLHDPKRLEPYAEFKHAVHAWGVTRDDAWIIVNALLREAYRRYDMLAALPWVDSKGREREGSVKWDPRVHGPIISVYWDEFHELAGWPEFVKVMEKLARLQRACAIRCTIASHMATLGDTGSQALRDMLAGGRALLLRTTSGLNAGLVTGGRLVGDPRTLPGQPGMCFVADGEADALMGRESFIPDDAQAEKMGQKPLYDWLFDDDNAPIGFPAEIPPETAEAFGREFMEWAEAGRLRGGRPASFTAKAVAVAERGVPQLAPVSSGAGDGTALDALVSILARASQPLTRAQIVGMPAWGDRNVTSTMTKALSDGQKAGLVEKDGAGYRLTARGRDEVAERQAVRRAEGEAA